MSAWQDYHRELTRLHAEAGAPSSRVVAGRADGPMSHATVNDLLKGRRLPGYPLTRRLVAALDGDWETFEPIWIAAFYEANPSAKESPGLHSAPRATVLDELAAIRRLLEQLVSAQKESE